MEGNIKVYELILSFIPTCIHFFIYIYNIYIHMYTYACISIYLFIYIFAILFSYLIIYLLLLLHLFLGSCVYAHRDTCVYVRTWIWFISWGDITARWNYIVSFISNIVIICLKLFLNIILVFDTFFHTLVILT